MKILVLFTLINLAFMQCDNYSIESDCIINNNCEWIDDIESGYCSDWSYYNTYNYNQCNAIDECEWSSYQIDCGTATGYSDCDISAGCSYSWLTYTCSGWTTISECSGGYYEIDDGHCQEIAMPECNEENEFQCNDGSCIPIHRVCNNINDCQDGADEINCEDCSELLEFNCINDDSCEWVENIEIENCNFAWSESNCQAHDGCEWECEMIWDSSLWEDVLVCDCYGQYQVDVGYCEEIVMPECSEMSETECSSDDVCEWVENIELVSCNDINSQQECNALGCSWYNGNYYACSICCWGEYEVDNSYCEETEILECSGMNESQCNNDNLCEWIIDYEWSTCSNYNSASACSWANDNGGNCDWSWNSTQWQDTCSGGSFQLDLSYCEESEYQLGDLNQDSTINIQDVIIVINLILNVEFDLNADINLDGLVNVLDAIVLVNIILNN